jgi:hypothetical protein
MAKKLSPFEEAFKEARAEGKKTFTFNGKSYGTVTGDDVQKKVDALPSMSRTQGETKTTQGATYPKPAAPAPASEPQASEKSLLDKYRESDMAKGFRDARATFGDTPSTDILMNTGKAGLAVLPVGRALSAVRPAIGAVVKRALKEDVPESFLAKEENQAFNPEKMVDRSRSEPAFNPDKMVDRRSTTFPGRSEPKFNPDKITGRDQPDPMKKGGAVKQYAKGGKISLNACGVSTHKPAKKNPNF